MSIDAMKQALEALNFHNLGRENVPKKSAEAITALRLAIEQAEKPDNNDGPINDGWQLSVSDGHSGRGVYAYMVEYPEEGAVFLMPIEQAEKQEPVAFFDPVARRLRQNPAFQVGVSVATWHGEIPLYTAPPQRQPLTEEEIDDIWRTHLSRDSRVRAIERAHGIGGEA